MRVLVQVWAGAKNVNHWADRFETAGYPVQTRTAEHLHLWLDLDPDGWGIIPAIEKLERALGLTDGQFFPAEIIKGTSDASV